MITQKLNFVKPKVELLVAVGGQKKDDLSKMSNKVKSSILRGKMFLHQKGLTGNSVKRRILRKNHVFP